MPVCLLNYTGESVAADVTEGAIRAPVVLRMQTSKADISNAALLRRIRFGLVLFIAGLVPSGHDVRKLERMS